MRMRELAPHYAIKSKPTLTAHLGRKPIRPGSRTSHHITVDVGMMDIGPATTQRHIRR